MVPLTLIVFLDMMSFTLMIPIIAPLLLNSTTLLSYTTGLWMRTFLLGLLLASYAIAQFFGAPMLGALSDRFGRKKMLLLSLAGSLVSYLAFGLGIAYNHLWLLFFSRSLAGFLGGNISITLSAIADVSDQQEKARNFGWIGVAFGFGFIIGPFIGGKLADPTLVPWFTYATPLWVASGLATMTLILCAIFFKETLTTMRNTPVSALTGFRNIRKAFYLPNLRVMFIIVFLLTVGFNFFTQFFQVYLIQKFSFNQSQIGDMFAYAGLWVAISQGFFTRPLSHRFRPDQILRWFNLICDVAMALLLVPESVAWLLIIIPFVLIAQGVIQPNALAIVSNLSDKDSQGEVLGINQSIQSLGMAIPPIIAGLVVSIQMALPMIVGSALTFLAAFIFILFYRQEKEKLFHEV